MVTQRRMENKRLQHKKKSIRNKIIVGVDCAEKHTLLQWPNAMIHDRQALFKGCLKLDEFSIFLQTSHLDKEVIEIHNRTI